jgi:hypothetical protein
VIIAVIIVVLSMIPLFIPFLYLVNLIYIGYIVAIVEKKYFLGWYKRMTFLCKKRWWKTAGVNAIAFLIIFIPMMIVAGASAFAGAASVISSGGQSEAPNLAASPWYLATMLLSQVISAVLMPMLMSIYIVYYNSLRAEKESADLSRQLDAVGTTPAKA